LTILRIREFFIKFKTVFLSVLLAVLSGFFSGEAQAGEQGLVGKGLKIGFGFSSLTGTDVYDWEERVTFTMGAFVDFRVTEFLAIQPELLYNCKGAEITLGGHWVGQSYQEELMQIKLKYLELALLFKLLPSKPGSVEIYQFVPKIIIGPVWSKNLSAKRNISGILSDEEVKENDFGLIIGGGLDNYMGRNCYITLDARFQFGFTNLSEIEGTDLSNKQFIVLLGFSF